MATSGTVTPVPRILDEAKAPQFYVNYLGFAVQFKHRFGQNSRYMRLSRGGAEVHPAEHHGDPTPGSRFRIETSNLPGFSRELDDREYRVSKRAVPKRSPGARRP